MRIKTEAAHILCTKNKEEIFVYLISYYGNDTVNPSNAPMSAYIVSFLAGETKLF